MATHGARRLLDMADNAANVVAVELLAATQGIEFHRPLKSSAVLEEVVTAVRGRVPHYDGDRYFAPDIEKVAGLVASGAFRASAGGLLSAETGH
jgi:histidine ammonia-lyase